MSYTVDSSNNVVEQDANTTDVDLSGLTGLVDSSGNSVVTVAGGDQSGLAGTQKLYTLLHPYVFDIKGTQTITPDEEQLFIENTDQRDNYQDFKINSGGSLFVAGETVASFGTFYSPSTWLRINRQSNDTFRSTKACFFVDANGGLDWRGGVAQGAAVFAITGNGSWFAPAVRFLHATWFGLSSNMFQIAWDRKTYIPTSLTVIGNRYVDGRSNQNTFGFKSINSLVEGAHGQTYTNYSGISAVGTWTRNGSVRTFLNSDYGMNLPVSIFTSNRAQVGGQIRLQKSVDLKIVDIQRSPLSDVKVVVKTYDDGGRINYPALPTASPNEINRFTNQVAVSDITHTTDSSGEFSFTNLLKEHTARQNLTSFVSNPEDFSGNFSAGDLINVTSSNPTRNDGEFLYHDTTTNEVFFRRTRNVVLWSTFDRMANLTQTGEAVWSGGHINQNVTNAVTRFTKGGDDDSPLGDVLTYAYGKQITSTELNYDGLDVLNETVFMLDNPFTSETDASVVAGYTTLENVNKLFDLTALRLYLGYVGQLALTANFVDGYLDFGIRSLVLDGTATDVLTSSGDTLTIGVGTLERFVGNLKAENITLINGATTSGLLNSGGVVTYPDRLIRLNNLVVGSRVYVYDLTNNAVLFNTVATTSTSDNYIASDGTDVQLMVKVRNGSNVVKYKQFRTEATLVASGVNIQINQPLDQ